MKDVELSRAFLIPERMLNRWKNSNDYRYLIYSFLEKSNERAIESFFTFQYNSDDNNSPSDKNISFYTKNEFIAELKDHPEYLMDKGYEIIDNDGIDSIVKEKDNKKPNGDLPAYTFFAKIDKDLTYIELSNRIPDKNALIKKIKDITNIIHNNFKLKKMIFITTEEDLPKYIRNNSLIEDVFIENVKIDDLSKDKMQTIKIIFLPDSKKDFKHPYIKKTEKQTDDILEKIYRDIEQGELDPNEMAKAHKEIRKESAVHFLKKYYKMDENDITDELIEAAEAGHDEVDSLLEILNYQKR